MQNNNGSRVIPTTVFLDDCCYGITVYRRENHLQY